MTDDYRRKLLNWFCSMLLAATACALSALIFWFYRMPQFIVYPEKEDITAIAGPLGESLIVFVVYFVPFATWHLFDFIERPSNKLDMRKRLSGYCALCLLSIATIALWLLMITGIFDHNSCDDLSGAFYLECFVGPPLWLLLPWIGGVGLMLVLCIAKAFISISSYRVKSQ